jgi:hypothetical protein
MRFLLLAGFLMATVMGAGPCGAAGFRDFLDSWVVSTAEARALLGDRCAAQKEQGGFWGMAGQGRLFEMPDLDQKFLGGGGEFNLLDVRIRMTGHWEQTGSALFVEHRMGWKLLLGRNPAIGVGGHWRQLKLGSRTETKIPGGDLLWEIPFGFDGGICGRVQIQWPIRAPQFSTPGVERRNLLTASVACSDLVTALVVDRLPGGVPNLGMQLLWALGSRVGLECRVDFATDSLGPGLAIVRGGLLLRTSHIVHPRLGVTHRMMLVFGSWGEGAP